MNVQRGISRFALSAVMLTAISSVAQKYPLPTPEQQAGIDKDQSRHFGDSPADGVRLRPIFLLL